MKTYWKILVGVGMVGGAILAVKALSVKLIILPQAFIDFFKQWIPEERIKRQYIPGKIIGKLAVYAIREIVPKTFSIFYVPENAQPTLVTKDTQKFWQLMEYDRYGNRTGSTWYDYQTNSWKSKESDIDTFKPDRLYFIAVVNPFKLELPLL